MSFSLPTERKKERKSEGSRGQEIGAESEIHKNTDKQTDRQAADRQPALAHPGARHVRGRDHQTAGTE